ncbi:nitroreductase/quinone reductase family protein [Streptosporangium sp. NPDC051022]|uniref:nitroreductase/quinone reductase family protein n=1 Tax=Streptosporangium sp. NPDC051022 TaxID=3155752 RepID=UPI0034396FF1
MTVFSVIAPPAEGARRDRLFEQGVREQPGYGDRRHQTARTIPVAVLERRSAPEM